MGPVLIWENSLKTGEREESFLSQFRLYIFISVQIFSNQVTKCECMIERKPVTCLLSSG